MATSPRSLTPACGCPSSPPNGLVGDAMSLTSQLHGGELEAWCRANLAGTGSVISRVQTMAAPRKPVRPVGQVGLEHWPAVGGAFGQRLAFLVEAAPPYYS